jgi:hypothetical protein
MYFLESTLQHFSSRNSQEIKWKKYALYLPTLCIYKKDILLDGSTESVEIT